MKKKLDSPTQKKTSKDDFLKKSNVKSSLPNTAPIDNGLAELKHLDRVLNIFISLGKEHSANKYLEGFLE